MLLISKYSLHSQSGFTLIQMMIVIAIVGILATINYQNYVRKTQVMIAYEELNHLRMPYEILVNEGAGVTGFSPDGLNMPEQTRYCQFTVMPPNSNKVTDNAIVCTIQNLS